MAVDRYGHIVGDNPIERVLDKKLKDLHETLTEMAPLGLRIIEQIEAKEHQEDIGG